MVNALYLPWVRALRDTSFVLAGAARSRKGVLRGFQKNILFGTAWLGVFGEAIL